MFLPARDAFALATPVLPRAPMPEVLRPAGFTGGTLVETAAGWCPVATLRPGACVATLDGGFAEVAGIAGRSGGPLVRIPGGALGNCSDLAVAPGQGLLLPAGDAAEIVGAAFVLIPAHVLPGRMGITLDEAPGGEPLYRLSFAGEEAIWVNSGVLLHCGRGRASDFRALSAGRTEAFLDLFEHGSPFGACARAA